MAEAEYRDLQLAVHTAGLRRNDSRSSAGATSQAPDGYMLVAAFRGNLGACGGDHPVVRWAQALAQRHRSRHINPTRRADIDRRRADLISATDHWMCAHTSLPVTDFGATIDVLAALYVEFEARFQAPEVDFDDLHQVWSALAEQVIAWSDLVADRHGTPYHLPGNEPGGR